MNMAMSKILLQDNWYLAIRSMTENLIIDAKSKGHKCRRGIRLLGFIDKFKSILEARSRCMVNFDLWAPNVICEKRSMAVIIMLG